MASFANSFEGDSFPQTESTSSFVDDDAYGAYNSQQFGYFHSGSDVLESQPQIYGASSDFAAEDNGKGFDGGLGGSDGPILPPPSEMAVEEGVALREWRRLNAIRLEEKEKIEKDLLRQIIEEADEYKVEFQRKKEIACENNKATNREKEKLFLMNQEKFYAEADKNYWKSISELIPNEVPALEKKREKKNKDSKPAITLIQGPKPGKPAELSRMRQILLKLKHSTPPHLKLSPPPAPGPAKDVDSGNAAVAAASVKAAVVTPEAVAVA